MASARSAGIGDGPQASHRLLTSGRIQAIMPTMAEPHTLGRLLELLAQLEGTAYDFYATLRRRYRDNRELYGTLADIMADEVDHTRVVREITESLPGVRLQSPVPADLIWQIADTLDFVHGGGEALFESPEAVCQAIERVEALEFDVVLSFVSLSEINFEFTRNYLQNQSVDHTNKIYRLISCLD